MTEDIWNVKDFILNFLNWITPNNFETDENLIKMCSPYKAKDLSPLVEVFNNSNFEEVKVENDVVTEFSEKVVKENFESYHICTTFLLLWIWGVHVWQIYLALRQYRTLKTTIKPTEELSFLPLEKFNQSRCYALDKIKHSIITCFLTLLINTIEIKFKLFYKFWSVDLDSDYVEEYIWLSTLLIFYYILDLPLSYYDGCVIKNKYSTLHRSLENFFAQEFRFFFLLLFIIAPLLTLTLNFIKNVTHFWLISWLFFTSILIFLICLYPGYISPFCEKYRIYPEGKLKKAIINFCETFGLNVIEVFELKSKSNNQHSNILIGKRLRGYYIIIDQNDLSQNEILAVLAHEIGHNYHRHHQKLIVMYSFYYFVMSTVFSCACSTNYMFKMIGFPKNLHPNVVNIISVLLYIVAPLNKFIRYYMNVFTREIELEADKFVVDSGLGEELMSAIIKRSQLMDVVCVFDELYSIWVVSQPPLVERLKLLQSFVQYDDISFTDEPTVSPPVSSASTTANTETTVSTLTGKDSNSLHFD